MKNIGMVVLSLWLSHFLSCTKVEPVVKIDQSLARSIAIRYLGEKSRKQTQLGIDSASLVFYQTYKLQNFFMVSFHDSSKGIEYTVSVDSLGFPEITASKIHKLTGNHLIMK